MKRLIWVTVIVPIVLSLALLFFMVNNHLDKPIVDIQIDDGALIVLVGALFSLLIALSLFTQHWQRRIHAENMAHARAETAEEHRRFLNRLDHELKNPLTAIRAGLANLVGTDAPDIQQDILASINTQVLRLGHLVSDLRKVADIGTRPLECLPVDLKELLHEAVAIAHENPLSEKRPLKVLVSPAIPPIIGDRDVLLLALHNLIGNALKFTRPGDQIVVSGRVIGNHAVIEIVDSGPGISPEEQPFVWRELYRGETAQGVPGSGIGLALVQAIVERHQGSVALHSSIGHGTTVTLKLPLKTNG